MDERRRRRSSDPGVALQCLVDSVAERSGVNALVLVDDAGDVVAHTGHRDDVHGLSLAARDVAYGKVATPAVARATREADMTARRVSTGRGDLYFAALGDRLSGVGEAVRAVQRIFEAPATAVQPVRPGRG